MVVAVLADDPNYEYYLQKLTTGSERCNSSGTVIVSPSNSAQMKQIVAE
jgi:hypothetical protein